MQIGYVGRIGGAFEPLQPIAFLHHPEGHAVFFGSSHELEIGDQRRGALAHIAPNDAAFVFNRIGGVAHFLAEFFVLGLGRLIQAVAFDIEQPAVIEAANAAVFDAAIGEIGAPMRAMEAGEAKPVLVIAKQHQLLGQNFDRHGIAADGHFLRRGNGLPIGAQQIAARRARPGPGYEIVLLLG